MYIFVGGLAGLDLPCLFLEALIIGVGMGVCMPTGTCHKMSMGRVGSIWRGLLSHSLMIIAPWVGKGSFIEVITK